MAARTAQKKRTRDALLSAARDLMADGGDVTVARAADAAGISRATAYRYFSDPGALAAEATLDLDLMSTDALLTGMTDTRDRVQKVARYYLEFTFAHEAEFRLYLAQTMRMWADSPKTETRGARRIDAFAQALAPVRAALPAADFQDLVHRLSMLTGLEALIAISDVVRTDPDTGYRLQAGIVDAVLDKYLASV